MGQIEGITERKVRKELKFAHRELIEQWYNNDGKSISEIAANLHVSPKTISRELKQGMVNNRDTYLRDIEVYSAYASQSKHLESISRRGRKPSVEREPELMKHIILKLHNKYSPDAIIGEIKRDGIFERVVCSKTVYNWLKRGYIQGFKIKSLSKSKAFPRRNIGLKNAKAKRIDERSIEAESREEFGHWEMDTVVGAQGSKACLLVLTERSSRYEKIFLLPDRTQSSVKAVFDRLERRYKLKFKDIFKSITCDNGSEFLGSEELESSCLFEGNRTSIYFAYPHCSWQRGSNENANKLIRKFIKKGEDMSKLPVSYIRRIEKWINNYPRRIFGYRTANMVRNALI